MSGFGRRLRRAYAALTEREELSARQAIVKVLAEAEEPMRAKDIIDSVLTMPGVTVSGEAPRKVIEARLVEGVQRGQLRRPSRGLYALASGKAVAA